MGNNEFNKTVGIKIREARKNIGFSMAELGKLVNLHESTVQRYEDGEIKSLDVEKLTEFAKALNISSAYLVGWDDKTEEKNTTAAPNPYDGLTPEEIEEMEWYKSAILAKREQAAGK